MKKITKKEQKRLDKKEFTRKDKEWALAVKKRDKSCVICGETKRLNAHHMFPREIKETRWLLENGISLCPGCHRFRINSAHRNPLWFYVQVEDEVLDLYKKINAEGLDILK